MVSRTELLQAFTKILEPQYFQDYCPNGLQIEGCGSIKTLVTGVSASQALVDAAIAEKADAILVHHGYFWKGENPCLTGMKFQRIKKLIENNINLFAYHLPLDAHPELGNNAQLAKQLGIIVEGGLEPDSSRSIGSVGSLTESVSGTAFAAHIEAVLRRKPLHIAGSQRSIQRVAWCTGGAQGYIEKAVALGVDAFVTGEASEQTTHIANECGIHFFAAGHHATERYGVASLGEFIAHKFQLNHRFIDIDNPV